MTENHPPEIFARDNTFPLDAAGRRVLHEYDQGSWHVRLTCDRDNGCSLLEVTAHFPTLDARIICEETRYHQEAVLRGQITRPGGAVIPFHYPHHFFVPDTRHSPLSLAARKIRHLECQLERYAQQILSSRPHYSP